MWSLYWVLFGLGTVKFMFSQATGVAMGLSFLEVFIPTTLGAWVCATIFYWLAEYFNKRYHRRKIKNYQKRVAKGLPPRKKKVFTRANKTIVKLKLGIGFYGIATLTPLFLSVPIGSIIVAKFYGKKIFSYWYILIVLATYSFLVTALLLLFTN